MSAATASTAFTATPPLTLVVAGDPAQLTGGYRYDAEIVAALRRRGRAVDVLGLAGRFPLPDELARRSLDQALGQLAPASVVIIDGLAMGGLPEVIAAHASRLRIVALIHHPLADEGGVDEAQRADLLVRELAALAHARRIIVTSAFSARRLRALGVAGDRLVVVEPGVHSAALAPADADPPRLLCVATLTPRKGHDVLLEALSGLGDLPWQCDCIGSRARDSVHAARISAMAHALGLEGRVRFHGEQSGAALVRAYAAADLFVLASAYEGYGMVVTEALACGLPVVTTTGGALADTLPAEAGLAVPPADAAALAAALRRVLTEPGLRATLRQGARAARTRLRDWADAAARFERALDLR